MDKPNIATTKLSVKQEKFCHLYLELGTASQAYRKVFDCRNMTPHTIRNEASLLKNTTKIKARITELQNELNAKTALSKERILQELEAIIDSRITDYINFDGSHISFKAFCELTDKQIKAVESLKQGKYGLELKLHGKNWTIDKICKMLGYDAPVKNEVTGKDGKDLVPDLSKLTTEDLASYYQILEKADVSST